MTKKPDIVEAKALIEAEEQKIVSACGEEIKAVLEKHKCILAGVPVVVPAGNGGFVLAANVVIQPKPIGASEG